MFSEYSMIKDNHRYITQLKTLTQFNHILICYRMIVSHTIRLNQCWDINKYSIVI